MSYRDVDAHYPKFKVIDNRTGQEVDPATCFTLIPSRDPNATVALRAYADAVRAELPQLAADLDALAGRG